MNKLKSKLKGFNQFLDSVGWVIVLLIFIVGSIIFFKKMADPIVKNPLAEIQITKPTLTVILSESECQSCIENLSSLNSLYEKLNEEGIIDMKGIVLSERKTDNKKIAGQFLFPFVISDDFNILRRFNIDRTPVLVGIFRNRKIVYYEMVPTGTVITEKYLKEGVLNRLYYTGIMPESPGK